MSILLLDIDWRFFDQRYMGEKLSSYILFATIVLVTFLLKKPVAALLSRISSSLAARYSYIQHKDTVRDMLFRPMEVLLQTVLYFIALNQLDTLLDHFVLHRIMGRKKNLDLKLSDVVDHIFLFLFIIFLTRLVVSFVDFIYYLRMSRARQDKNYARMQLYPLIREMTKLIAWTLSGFWILGGVFHVNVPALITGLGIGGVAIALAGKETVENFFAAFTILSDKPFQVGDVIKLGEIEGTVELIGFRSTRLRNLDGSAYIIPNQNLVSQNLINLSARDTRGMKVVANIKYGIKHDTLQALITDLKAALHSFPLVKDPVEITVETFDKETFQMVINYHLSHPLPPDANLAAIKRDVNLKIFEIITAQAQLGTPVGTS